MFSTFCQTKFKSGIYKAQAFGASLQPSTGGWWVTYCMKTKQRQRDTKICVMESGWYIHNGDDASVVTYGVTF